MFQPTSNADAAAAHLAYCFGQMCPVHTFRSAHNHILCLPFVLPFIPIDAALHSQRYSSDTCTDI